MKEKVVIKVLPEEGCNPEFAPDEKMQEGLECCGFLVLAFDEDGKIDFSIMNGISIKNITEAMKHHWEEPVLLEIRQACAIAEGWIRANEICKNAERTNMAKGLGEYLRNALTGKEMEADEDPEDE